MKSNQEIGKTHCFFLQIPHRLLHNLPFIFKVFVDFFFGKKKVKG